MLGGQGGGKPPGWGLGMAFIDQSPSYSLGFEAGKLWERLHTALEDMISETVHTDNREQIRDMALTLGWGVDVTPLKDGWDQLKFTRIGPRQGSVGLN